MNNLSDTSLTKLGYSRLDKLCDAKFVKSFFKSTKKDFAHFISENDEVKEFLTSLEDKIVEADDQYKEMIQEYMESISDEINQFRTHLKELQRKKKLNVLEMQKKLLREEILREMEAEKKKQEIIEKLGISKNDKKELDNEEKANMTPTLKFKNKKSQDPKSDTKSDSKSNSKSDSKSEKKPENNIEKEENDREDRKFTSDPNGEKEGEIYQKSMDLGEFYAFLKEVIKNDILIIKNDKGRMKIRDIDLDNDVIRIKVE